MTLIRFLSTVCLLSLLWSCAHDRGQDLPTPFLKEDQDEVEDLLETLSPEQKIGQLIMVRSESTDSAVLVQLADWARSGTIGGIMAYGLSIPEFLNFRDRVESSVAIPMFWGTNEAVALNNQFSGSLKTPSLTTIRAVGADSLAITLREHYHRQLDHFHLNWVSLPRPAASSIPTSRYDPELPTLDFLSDQHMLSILEPFPGEALSFRDSVLLPEPVLAEYRQLVAAGAAGLWLDSLFLAEALPRPLPDSYLRHYLRLKLNFDGLLVATAPSGLSLLQFWQAGVDLFVTDGRPDIVAAQLGEAYRQGIISEEDLNSRLRKVLLAKSWMRKHLPVTTETERQPLRTLQASLINWRRRGAVPETASPQLLDAHIRSSGWRYLNRRIYESALTIASNSHGLLPLDNDPGSDYYLFEYSQRPFKTFRQFFEKYAPLSSGPVAELAAGAPSVPVMKSSGTAVVLLDEYRLESHRDSEFIREVQRLGREGKLVLVNFREPTNLQFFDSTLTVVQLYERNDLNEELAAQLLFGALPGGGKLPVYINEQFPAGKGNIQAVTRLKYGLPEEVGIAPEKLVGINAITQTAIDKGATPGCQVLIVKDGRIIYDENFGYHSYENEFPVQATDLYDLASITKVAATTLGAMKLYEQGAFKLEDRLDDHLPLEAGSTIGEIQLQKLFIHQSGLQPHMPVIPYLLFRDRVNNLCDHYFCKENREPYTVEVASEFFFDRHYLDTIWQEVARLPVRNQRKYRYSDVNFMLIQQMVEQLTGEPLDLWVDEQFYRSLGLRHTTFRPLDRFELGQIVPTQNDKRWRRQLVHGFVHDETAALMGGVAGHAGLFSTAEDLAVIFQMLLNGGTYGGRQYFEPATVEYFTSAGHGNHRGLGFDKPYLTNETSLSPMASDLTFGHTGFTGGCVWVDPAENLIFIFLSNRLHPRRTNGRLFREKTRRRIHDVIYNALGTYPEFIPELPVKQELTLK